MKKTQARTLRGVSLRALAAAALLLAAAFDAPAQGRPPGASAPGLKNPKGGSDGETNREAKLRSAELGAEAEQVNRQQLAAAIEQTKQDFKRIQLLRNDLVDRLVAKQPLDYKQLASQAEEINKRAGRLKSFLMKAAPADAGKGEGKKGEGRRVEYDEAAMRSSLVKLCNTIYSFTNNAMFKNPAVVGAQEPVKAGGELLAIIELSENIKRNAERLAKSPK